MMRWATAVLLCATLSGVAQSTNSLVYVKRPTREATIKASVEATVTNLAPLAQTPWHALGKTPGRDLAKTGREGEIDLLAEWTGADKGAIRWKPYPDLREKEWHALPGNVGWLYRTVISETACDATVRIGVTGFIKVYVNGFDNQSFATTASMADRIAEFSIQLRTGTNHLLILTSGSPMEFYYELSPMRADLMAALEAKLDIDFPALSEGNFYRMETIAAPSNIVLEVGGLTFNRVGELMIATRRGDIWAVRDGRWNLFASGLHEPLGIVEASANEYFVLQRPELTRLEDTDGDGTADVFETIASPWGLSGGHHEYIFGPVRDSRGNLWGVISGLCDPNRATYCGWCFKVTPEGKFVPWCSGLRSPNGIGITPDDEIFIADNQGEYVGTSPLFHVSEGAFLGHPVGLKWDPNFKGDPFKTPIEQLDKLRKPAAVLFPYGSMGHSLSQPLVDTTGGRFGPFAGQMFIGDQSKSTVMRVFLEKVNDQFQGACFPFRSGFQSGNNRLCFAPDGSLYVGQTDRGWGAVGGKAFGLQRLIWTGKAPFEIAMVQILKDGFRLTFTRPARSLDEATNYSVQHYRYLYHAKYGSPVVDQVAVKVSEARPSSDGRSVELILPEMAMGKIYEIHVRNVVAAGGAALLHPVAYYTVNQLPD